jgi:hypothetical protein
MSNSVLFLILKKSVKNIYLLESVQIMDRVKEDILENADTGKSVNVFMEDVVYICIRKSQTMN